MVIVGRDRDEVDAIMGRTADRVRCRQRAGDLACERIDRKARGQSRRREVQRIVVRIGEGAFGGDGDRAAIEAGLVAKRNREFGRIIDPVDGNDQVGRCAATMAVADRIGDGFGSGSANRQGVIRRAGIKRVTAITAEVQHAAACRGKRHIQRQRMTRLRATRDDESPAVDIGVGPGTGEDIAGNRRAVFGDRAGVIGGYRIVVDPGDDDAQCCRRGAAIGVGDLITERVGGLLAAGKGIDRDAGVVEGVRVAAIGVQRQCAISSHDAGADAGCRAGR